MSEIRATTISDEAGTGPITLTKQSAAKAWVNFNGTGTPSIRGSENVSSLTDNAGGDYDINFTNNMANANYCTTGSCAYISGTGQPNFGHDHNDATKSTSDENILVVYQQSVVDPTFAEAAIFGDLA